MIIFPAIDLLGGRCVRLVHGDYLQSTTYGDDPGAMARSFVDAGASWIHAVDLDGAKAGQPVNLDAVRSIVAAGVPVQMGGGLRTADSIRQALDLGVARVILGSVLVHDPEFACSAFVEFGDRVVAGIDAREGRVATQGWLETSELTAGELARHMVAAGAQRFVFTDIGRDGTLAGPNIDALSTFIAQADVPVIASGGVGSYAHVETLAQLETPPEGVIVGKAIYEGHVDVGQLVRDFQRSEA